MHHAFRLSRRVMVAVAVCAFAGGTALAVGASARSSHHPGHGNNRSHKTLHGSGGVTITSEPWGTADGHAATLFTLSNRHRMTVKITNYGGVVQSIWVPDRRGRVANVALGFPKLDDYVNDFEHQPWPAAGGSGNTYFGAIIGRYANRIANAQFTLDGTTYHLGTPPGTRTTGRTCCTAARTRGIRRSGTRLHRPDRAARR